MNVAERIASRERDRSRSAERQRGKGIHGVDQARYRDDLGFNMTDESYSTFQGEQSEFNTKISNAETALSEYRGTLDEATDTLESSYASSQSKIDEAAGGIPTGSSLGSIDDLWAEAEAGLKTVRVVDGSNVEAVYRLREEDINNMNSSVFNQGDGSYVAKWVDDGAFYNIDVTPQGTSDKYGKELHQSISSAADRTKEVWYESAVPQYNTALSQERAAAESAWGEINAAQATLDEQYNTGLNDIYTQETAYMSGVQDVKDEKALWQGQIDGAKDDFDKSVKHRQSLFGG